MIYCIGSRDNTSEEPKVIRANISAVIDIDRFGNLKKLLRVTAYVLRFVKALKKAKQHDKGSRDLKFLSASEIEQAEIMWLLCSVQELSFAKESEFLQRDVRTIRERERFWIIRGREAVKIIIKDCVVCRKAEGLPYNYGEAPDLPSCRVSEDPPFTNVGLDFAGRLYVQDKKNELDENSKKVYVLLFTCASTRAVHLEITPFLTAKSFLSAFRRFTSRRGSPALLLSDNAKTFKAACKEIRRLCRAEEVWCYLAEKKISWKFIVEKAPWWGGFWERLVRSIKRPLKKEIGRTSLSFHELRTLIVEIEGLLNARPITYVYDDTEAISYPLAPSHLWTTNYYISKYPTL
jgi:hypothetical protein